MVRRHNEEIAAWLKEHKEEIKSGAIRVLAIDESHLSGGDSCGQGWADKESRREVKVGNYRDSQSYYGALDCVSGEFIVSRSRGGNTEETIEFVKRLREASGEAKLVIIWDGASYHRSQGWREYLEEVNREEWEVHCLRFGPYGPEENPVENVWGQIKGFLKRVHRKCEKFAVAQRIFEMFVEKKLYTPPNMSKYAAFSELI